MPSTHLPVAENTRLGIKGEPASNEYRNFTGGTNKKTLVQKLNGADSKSKPATLPADSNFIGQDLKTVRNMNTVKLH